MPLVMNVRTVLAMLGLSALMPLAQAAETAAGAFVADPQSSCKVWNPHPQAGESVRWAGSCVNGLAEGKGKLDWLKSGTVIETDDGEWRAGHQVGRAVQVWSGGRYEGEVKDGLPHGPGTLTIQAGRYEGEFKNGKADGTGTLRTGGKSYQGAWVAGCHVSGKEKAAIGIAASNCP